VARWWENNGGKDYEVGGPGLEELGRLGAHQRGYPWWRGSTERETAVGGQTRAHRRRLLAGRVARNWW
jgi:hypothetical protein